MFIFSSNTQRHGFHLVDPSILPFISSISVLSLTLGSVLYFNGFIGGLESLLFGVSGVLLSMFI
jgi:cytochrome c oxidase subunit 3